MNSKIIFYSLLALMLLVSGYAVYRLFGGGSDSTSVSEVTRKISHEKTKSHSLESSAKSPEISKSIWNDPRLKNLKIQHRMLEGVKLSAELENNLNNLLTLYDQGADDQFLALLNDLISKNPDVKEYAALKGDYYYNAGNWPEAEKAITRLTELDPNNEYAQTTLGEVKAMQGHPDDGLAIAENVLNKNPGNTDALYDILSFTQMKGNAQAGVDRVLDIYAQHSDDPGIAVVAADVMLAQGNYIASHTALQQALQKNPDSPIVLIANGKDSFELGQNDEAISLAEHAFQNAKQDENKLSALDIIFQAAYAKKDIAKAQDALNRKQSIAPGQKLLSSQEQSLQKLQAER